MIATESEVEEASHWGPSALRQVREARRVQQESLAPQRSKWIRANRYFYDRLKRLLRFIIDPQKRVLEVRCETGHLLASL
jgi:hypothetical protein